MGGSEPRRAGARGRTAGARRRCRARVRIVDRAATTTLQIELHNPSATQQEAVLLLPVPDGAAVSSFAFEGAAATPTARVLPRDEARRPLRRDHGEAARPGAARVRGLWLRAQQRVPGARARPAGVAPHL
jgi:hypothetical protein